MKVQMIIGVLDLAVGDVVEVPPKVAALWGASRMARRVVDSTDTTAQLAEQDFGKILSGLDIS